MEKFSIEILSPPAVSSSLPTARPTSPASASVAASRAVHGGPPIPPPALGALEKESTRGEEAIGKEELIELINQCFSQLKVYVLESEITDAQNNVRAIIEKSKL